MRSWLISCDNRAFFGANYCEVYNDTLKGSLPSKLYTYISSMSIWGYNIYECERENGLSEKYYYMPIPTGVYHYLNSIKDTDEYTISDSVYKCCIVMGFLVYKWNVNGRKAFLCTNQYLSDKTYITRTRIEKIVPFLGKLGFIAVWYDDKGQRNISVNEEKIEQMDDEYRAIFNQD